MRVSLLSLSFLVPSVCLADNIRGLSLKRGKSSKSSKSDSSDSSDDQPELPFLDQVEYPYDPWLPQEDPTNPTQRLQIPSLSLPFYDNVIDVRATVSAKDTELIVSTAGNWQFALTELLNDKFVGDNPTVQAIKTYLITTSPPISIPQMQTGQVKVGNILYTDAEPHVAIGPPPVMQGLTNNGFIASGFTPFSFYQNYGNVILKLKGNTKINSFADLAKIEPGRFASATVGAVNNYRNSIRNIFNNNPALVEDLVDEGVITTGELLEARLFDEGGVAAIGPPMHQSIPHVLVRLEADAGLMLLELAVGIMRNNPGVFEAIYLASDKTGSTDNPEVLKTGQVPLEGNQVVTIQATKTTTVVSTEQEIARDLFVDQLSSADLTVILANNGLRRPPGFVQAP